MYATPEIRELGTVTAYTLGSAAGKVGGSTPVSKGTVDQADAFTNDPTSNLYGTKGTPCTISAGTIGTYPCS